MSEERKRPRDDSSAPRSPVREALVLLDEELHRSRLAYAMCEGLHQVCADAHMDDMSLFVGFVFETIAARSIYELQHRGENLNVRTWLHPQLDPGQQIPVRVSENGNEWLGIFEDVKFFDGKIFGLVKKQNDAVGGAPLAEVPLELCTACTPIPVALDPMLPCGEIVQPHKSPQSIYQLSLSKLCEADKGKLKSFNSKKKKSWEIADAATKLAHTARMHMASYTSRAVARSVHVSFRSDEVTSESEAILEITNDEDERENFPFETTHRLVKWQYDKLRKFFSAANPALSNDTELFHYRLYIMLQRYTGVTGLFSRIEAGWHAAVPPAPFDYLRSLGAEAECFASPLNARLSQFCSAFHDTDKWFGSKGSFMNFFPTSGLFEVGPPYDHEVMRIAFDHAIECLESKEVSGPLCFVFIVPDSTRDSGIKVRANVDKSPYNRVSEVLPKFEAKYIDGFQHRPGENRLITISCDTRIVILQNDAAATKWPPSEHFAEFKRRWLSCNDVIATSGDVKK